MAKKMTLREQANHAAELRAALAPVEAKPDDGLKACGKCGARALAFNCDTPGCPVAWK